MRASIAALRDSFDIVVVGGGVHGAFAALEASRRGLRVALVERRDFASGTSANSLRIAHGGLRYLGRADWRRMRESIRERAALMRMAPHLVRPLPCAMPIRGAAQRPFIAAALAMNDVLTGLHARDVPLPASEVISCTQMHTLAGPEWWGGERAAALWHDALVVSPERLIVMVLREAVANGAIVRNYTEATALLRSAAGDVHGIAARAEDDDRSVEVRASVVLDTTGRSSTSLTGRPAPCAWAMAWNIITARPAQQVAVAIPFPAEQRLLFAVPWRERMVLGTGYAPAGTGLDHTTPAGAHGRLAELAASLIAGVHDARPELALTMDDVALVQAGTLPMISHSRRGVALLDRPAIVHHARVGGAAGLVSMFGVKWTTARATAGRAIDLCEHLVRGGRTSPALPPAPLCASAPADGTSVSGPWAPLYGPLAGEVAAIASELPAMREPLVEGAAMLTAAEVVHAVRMEGAVHLADVLLRRTEAATAGWPGEELVTRAAAVMAQEAGWSDTRIGQECDDVRRLFGKSA